jgi:4-hydroxy-tetrahydrodipicolinate reductase
MGTLACAWIQSDPRFQLVAEIGRDASLERALRDSGAEVAIDLTTAAAARSNAHAIVNCNIRPVIGTSGLSAAEIAELAAAVDARSLGGLVVPNFSIGAVLGMRFAEEAAKWFTHVEIVEAHHATKPDAPSGTARATAERIGRVLKVPQTQSSKEIVPGARGGSVESVRVHSIRMAGVLAHQECWFGSMGETLKIVHDTTDYSCFRAGLLLAAAAAPHLRGLIVGIESLLRPPT